MRRLFIAALALATCSCERDPAGLEKRPRLRVAGGPVEAPAGGKWKSARVEIVVLRHTRIASGRNLPYEQVSWSVEPHLVLDGAVGEVRVLLADGAGGAADAPELPTAADAAWKVVWAPDGRGVACLRGGAAGWLWIACDGPRPLHCIHFRIAPPDAGDPYASGPGWRGLALEMMDPAGRHGTSSHPEEWDELASLIAETPDPALLRAFAAAAVREGSGLSLPDLKPEVLRPLQRAAAADEVVVATALEALGRKKVAGALTASNASMLLAAATTDAALRAMAAALTSEDWAPAGGVTRDYHWPEAVGWSLARAVDSRKDIPPDVEQTMLGALEAEGRRDRALIPVMFVLGFHGSEKAQLTIEGLFEVFVGSYPNPLGSLEAVEAELGGSSGDESLKAWSLRVPRKFR